MKSNGRHLITNRLVVLLTAGVFGTVVCGAAFFARSARSKIVLPVVKQTATRAEPDACSLVTEAEIASVQRVRVQAPQPSRQRHGQLIFSQCYYTAVSADGRDNLSVYLQLIQSSSTATPGDAVKEFWKDRFERDREEEREREREAENEEGEERIDAPVRVTGIGQEAFWLGTSRGGALYVLQKDAVLRVTVGGRDVKGQIEKSKVLAKKALRRLS